MADETSEIGRQVIANIEAHGTDPAVAEWRESLLQLAERKGQSTSAQLRETQAALAASQADLTRVERVLRDADDAHDRTRAELGRTKEVRDYARKACQRFMAERDALAVLNAELKAEAAHWRAAAERHLTQLGEVGKSLATARYQNRLLSAELASARQELGHRPTIEEKP